jgi:hypothetical protein
MKIQGSFKPLNFYLLIGLMLFLSGALNAQSYSRVKILTGGSPSFIVNSLKKYYDGITLSNWTRLRLELNDLDVPPNSKWQLSFLSNTSKFESDGSAQLNLNVLFIRVESFTLVSNTSIDIDNSPIALSINPGPAGYGEVILEGTGVVNMVVELSISYDLGTGDVVSNNLIGSIPEQYTSDLIFRLYSVP